MRASPSAAPPATPRRSSASWPFHPFGVTAASTAYSSTPDHLAIIRAFHAANPEGLLVHAGVIGVSTLMPVSRPDPECAAEERPSGGGEVERDREGEGEREAVPKVRIGRREEA